eukprot:SAG25_NODE_880_length_4970_cov_4.557380_8_plen_68_part_00
MRPLVVCSEGSAQPSRTSSSTVEGWHRLQAQWKAVRLPASHPMRVIVVSGIRGARHTRHGSYPPPQC